MHEFPQALPFLQILQHAMGVGGVVPWAASDEMVPFVHVGSELLPRLAVAVASTTPITDAQTLNAALMMLSLKSCLQGYGSSTPLDTARDRCRNGARLD